METGEETPGVDTMRGAGFLGHHRASGNPFSANDRAATTIAAMRWKHDDAD
jgi:hypothetical protein